MAARKKKAAKAKATRKRRSKSRISPLGLWRRIYVRTWSDEKFRALDDHTKLLWIYLLTGPHTTSIPGLFAATAEGLAGSLKWSRERFSERFGVLCGNGMAHHDAHAGLVWLPKVIKYEPPANQNVIMGWRSPLAILPECGLLKDALSGLRGPIVALGDPFKEAFDRLYAERFGQPYAEPSAEPYGESGSRNQEEGLSTPKPPAGGVVEPKPATKKRSSKRRRTAVWEGDFPWDAIVQTWNENAGGLPRLAIGVIPNEDREHLARRLWLNVQNRTKADAGDHDDDYALGLLAPAIRRCGKDGYYVQNNHGFDTFCRNADRWLDAPGIPETFSPETYRPDLLPPDHPHHALWASS